MIERYIYAVIKELPKNVREEVAAELRALIGEMIDGMDDSFSEEEKINRVLRELGNPKELANRYRGKERYLIGPKYFDQYILVIKIVILSVFIGISTVSGFAGIFSMNVLSKMIGSYIGTLFSAVMQGVAWVTVVFAVLEYKDSSYESNRIQEEWDPSQLPELPDEKALISRGESIFAIIISTIMIFFFFIPDKVGLYYLLDGQLNFIPLFNPENLAPFKVVVFIVFIINIVIELIKIIEGRWTMRTAVSTTILHIISAALIIFIMNIKNIWNSDIAQSFELFTTIPFENAISFAAVVIVIVTITSSASALYKGVKYGNRKYGGA